MEKGWCKHTNEMAQMGFNCGHGADKSFYYLSLPNVKELNYCIECGKERPKKKSLADAIFEISAEVSGETSLKGMKAVFEERANKLKGMIKNGEIEDL